MLQTWRLRRHSERGETLIEVLVSIAILGIAGVSVLAGLQLTIKASDIHRKETTGGAYVRSFAEAIEKYVGTTAANKYIPCAGPNAYNVSAVTSQLDLDLNAYTLKQDQAQNVSPTTGAAVALPCVAANDTGIQQLTLHVVSKDNKADERLTIVLRKPCSPDTTAC